MRGRVRMKRLSVSVLAMLLVLGIASVADADRRLQLAVDAMDTEQAWTAWLLGSSSDPLFTEDFCGEIVDGRFLLTISVTGATELDCAIPAGVEVVASPFGGIAWSPTDGTNGTSLFNAALRYVRGVVPRLVNVQVDGTRLEKEPLICSLPFTIALEEGNSLQQLDPKVKGDSTKAVICAWMYLIDPLSTGEHTIDVSGGVKGSPPFELRFNVTVA
jgi:hypothetical protein